MTVSYEGLTTGQAEQVASQLRRLRGYLADDTNDKRSVLRYHYKPAATARLIRDMQKILRHAGIADPEISSFDIWQAEIALRELPEPQTIAPLCEAIEKMLKPACLNSYCDMGRKVVVFEFKGQPGEGLVSLAENHLYPYAAT